MNESERRLLLAIARLLVAEESKHQPGLYYDMYQAWIEAAENAKESATPSAQDSAIASAWAPVTDPDQTRHVWAKALAADLAREIDEKAKQYAKSPSRDTPGGAGGGDPLPLPDPEAVYRLMEAVNGWSLRALKAEADASRLSLVHQQLREQLKIWAQNIRTWCLSGQPANYHEMIGMLCALEVELALAASTTETPP